MHTNLRDIIQNPHERVAILEPRCYASLSIISHHRKSTYFWSVWNSGHLNHVILTSVVGVFRKGFCCSPDGHGPEQAALCPEAPDEDTLVQYRGRIVLSTR